MDFFREEERKIFGERGSEVAKTSTKEYDLDRTECVKSEIYVSFCNCSRPLTEEDRDEVYRCTVCDEIICSKCRIQVSRRNLCPSCALNRYGIDKPSFIHLFLIEKDVIDLEDLVEEESRNGTTVIRVNESAAPLLNHGLVSRENSSLTTKGKEALTVGKKVYGDDSDVKEVAKEVKVQKVVENP